MLWSYYKDMVQTAMRKDLLVSLFQPFTPSSVNDSLEKLLLLAKGLLAKRLPVKGLLSDLQPHSSFFSPFTIESSSLH